MIRRSSPPSSTRSKNTHFYKDHSLTKSAGCLSWFSFPLNTPVLNRIENQGCPACSAKCTTPKHYFIKSSRTRKYPYIVSRVQTWRAPLISTLGLSPIMYRVLKTWFPPLEWLANHREETSSVSTASAFLNTDGFGLPKHVYSRALVWTLHYKTGSIRTGHIINDWCL